MKPNGACGWLVCFLLLTLAACHNYDNKDYAAMNDIPMQTVCVGVGRMLVDLPKGKQSWQQEFNYAKVSKLPITVNTKEAFDAYVEKRQNELAKPTDKNPNGRIAKMLPAGDKKIIILFRDTFISETDGIMKTERYSWNDSHGYKYIGGTMSDANAFEVAGRIKKIGNHVISIQNTNPPDTSGFCIDSALVTGNTGPIWSAASVNVKRWEGVSVDAWAREDDGTRDPLPWQSSSDSK